MTFLLRERVLAATAAMTVRTNGPGNMESSLSYRQNMNITLIAFHRTQALVFDTIARIFEMLSTCKYFFLVFIAAEVRNMGVVDEKNGILDYSYSSMRYFLFNVRSYDVK